MRATVWSGRNQVRVENVPDPKIINGRDTGYETFRHKQDECVKVVLTP